MGVATLEQGRISRQDAKYVRHRLFQVTTFASDGGRIEIAASPGAKTATGRGNSLPVAARRARGAGYWPPQNLL
ncbi:hypothetical protein DBZ45_18470 [Arthrobacter globiformis]|uniref:Uncharacterized protein n=1 Tax=Arthrobacter globiformis TaxID=1665 RepID=A0A328HC41_ARTGO|nr:hypothetical protein DBZ45_18470 [Arthrobacter globiformis]